MSSEHPKIGIVCAVRNCLDLTVGAIQSVHTSHAHQVYVIDDGSDRPMKDWLASRTDITSFIDPQSSTGLAWNWNLGIAAAINDGCSHILVMNNDIVLHPETIDRMVSRVDCGDVDLVSGFDIRELDGKLDDLERWDLGRGEDRERLDFSCFIITAETVRRFGWFDENFVGAYYEDNDYYASLILNGGHAIRYGSAPYYHHSMRTVQENPEIAGYVRQCAARNAEYFRWKWGRMPANSADEVRKTYRRESAFSRGDVRTYREIVPDYRTYLSLQTTVFESFEETNPHVVESMRRTLQWLTRRLSPGASVLDAACGDGTSLTILKELGFSPTGVEYSDNKVRRAMGKGDVVQADLHDLTILSNGQFDCVLSSHTLEHMYDPEGVVNEFRRVLKPDGQLLIVLPYPDMGNEQAHGGKYILGTDRMDGGQSVIGFFNRMGFDVLEHKLDDGRELEIWIAASVRGLAEQRLEELFQRAAKTPSDISEHLETLRQLASSVRTITEFGGKTTQSTCAFAMAKPDRLRIYEPNRTPQNVRLEAAARLAKIDFQRIAKDAVDCEEIDETDLLFIGSAHAEDRTYKELSRHASKVNRFLVLHDTDALGDQGERGVWRAVCGYMRENPEWRLWRHYPGNSGLTVFTRVM